MMNSRSGDIFGILIIMYLSKFCLNPLILKISLLTVHKLCLLYSIKTFKHLMIYWYLKFISTVVN